MADQIMTESKPPKRRLLRRILWWLWVILLTALLVLGFVLAAPWKVITLIAIFLIAATILPRAYRKWFWLGVGLVVLAIIAWIFLPDDNKDWKPYQFDKELAQLQARYAVPDSENAAIIYNQILADWKQKEANEPNLPRDWHDIAWKGPWLNKDQPEIAAYIQYHRDEIEAVLQATKIEKCSFPIVANFLDSDKKNMDATTVSAIDLARLLVIAGNNDLAEGNTNEAIEKYLAVIRMGQHFCWQPYSLYFMVGIVCEGLSLENVDNFVVSDDANEYYLDKLEQSVSKIKYDWKSWLPGFIDAEKLAFKNMAAGLFFQVNFEGKVRLTHNSTAMIIRKQFNPWKADKNDVSSGYWRKKLVKAQTILIWFYSPTTPEKLGELVDSNREKYYKMADPDFVWPEESDYQFPNYHFTLNLRRMLNQMNENSFCFRHDTCLDSLTKQKGTLLIIALRRYKNANGHWPEKLEDINNFTTPDVFVDPVNNDSFGYKCTGDTFMLYSKGKNRIDDGGEYETKFNHKLRKYETIKDDRMIGPYKGSDCN
jgi:hypothetical protein